MRESTHTEVSARDADAVLEPGLGDLAITGPEGAYLQGFECATSNEDVSESITAVLRASAELLQQAAPTA